MIISDSMDRLTCRFWMKKTFAINLQFPKDYSNISGFRSVLSKSHNVLAFTGAGISAESHVPTFRRSGESWRNFHTQDLATPDAFHSNPGLVWEFYHYCREVVRSRCPNAGHLALAHAEKQYTECGRSFFIITQNVDGLHAKAGCVNVLELHGNLYKTRCLECNDIRVNFDKPICAALLGRGSPIIENIPCKPIPLSQLPRCQNRINNNICGGLLRPHVVWFGENLEPHILSKAGEIVQKADVCLVVGASSAVYPVASFTRSLANRGIPVAEINVEVTPATHLLQYHFQGKSGDVLPKLFDSLTLT
ncbi:putative chromatin regulatory protein sir2 [Schistosoma mansoni]|uniref:Putative chromatin regulatory protein sir2 n=1 Tax=Schistosoma mansoni TaxID=6183 RepID=G4VH77_SCHMA|nr:putative chromatin regulatory protein sir2 [Schistosoma mansoni]|eukprot:XP_018652344.1 putative chromatin regulatory protein sir2 [Schistosoma mansoni]